MLHPEYSKKKIDIDTFESQCRLCNSDIVIAKNGKYGKSFSDHLKQCHSDLGIDRQMYHQRFVFDNKIPTCSCQGCVANQAIAKPVRWVPNGYFAAFSTGHNRTMQTTVAAKATDERTEYIHCLECDRKDLKSNHALSLHLAKHKMKYIDYIVKHLFNDIYPKCNESSCDGQPRFVDGQFKRYCSAHAHIAESEGGVKGGSHQHPNKGVCPTRIRTGAHNPFYGKKHTDETKKINADKHRLTHEEFTKRTTRKPDEYIVLSSYTDYDSRQTSLNVRCQKCQLEFEATLENLDRDCSRCSKCFPSGRSIAEEEIAQYVESLGFEVIRNDRDVLGGKEIDVWIPSKQFGIEYNGLWWHCEANNPDNNAVRNKHIVAAENNIKLLTIFEDEWLNKREILQSMIAHRLGVVRQKYHARKCKIIPIDVFTAREFLEASHLDGYARSTHRLGLVTNDNELIAVMTLGIPQQKKWSHLMEVKRFATAPDIHVHGALGKLSLAGAAWTITQGYQGLLTYVHRRIGTGQGYISAGYQSAGHTAPDFFWTTGGGKRLGRQVIQANSKLGLTERQVAASRDVHRIYAAGSSRFIL